MATTGRTWKRLGPVITLAVSDVRFNAAKMEVVADIGCDHGLLSFGLAATGIYNQVYGVDVSPKALEQGAWAMLQNSKSNNSTNPKIQFFLGNGLQPLLQRKIGTICMAGMGVHTMISIMSEPTQLKTMACQRIVVQPTNSRPRHLQQLYNHVIATCGFSVMKEHITQSSSKQWYLSTLFQINPKGSKSQATPALPGQWLLENSVEQEQRFILAQYIQHHKSWILDDYALRKRMDPLDQIWLSKMNDATARDES